MTSLLFTPCSTPALFEKGLKSEATGIIMDLEDGVGAVSKEVARAALLQTDLLALRKFNKNLIIRVNNDENLEQDLLTIHALNEFPDLILLPKVDSAEPIEKIVHSLSQIKNKTTKLLIMIENVKGLENMKKIIGNYPDFIYGTSFGAADFCAEEGTEMSWETLAFYRQILCYNSFLYKKPVFDSPFFDIHQPENLAIETAKIKAMGMKGKLCIHPSQCAIVNKVFQITEKEYEKAQSIVKAFEDNDHQSIKLHGQMIDEPIYKQQLIIIENYFLQTK